MYRSNWMCIFKRGDEISSLNYGCKQNQFKLEGKWNREKRKDQNKNNRISIIFGISYRDETILQFVSLLPSSFLSPVFLSSSHSSPLCVFLSPYVSPPSTLEFIRILTTYRYLSIKNVIHIKQFAHFQLIDDGRSNSNPSAPYVPRTWHSVDSMCRDLA